jgi:hypothetical protein
MTPCISALHELNIPRKEENERKMLYMLSFKIKGIDRFSDSQMHKIMKNLLILKNQPEKLKNFNSNKNSGIKKNKNFYILLQIIFPKRRCL